MRSKNGTVRLCGRKINHSGKHRDKTTCRTCGLPLPRRYWVDGRCLSCKTNYRRRKYGHKPRKSQTPGSYHEFSCGCSGILPDSGESNQFSKWSGILHFCRVSKIIGASAANAKRIGCAPIDPDTSHFVIREMMKKENCILCQEKLEWKFGAGQTPHLHHNHVTGEIYGFTHNKCNPLAMEHRIRELEQQLANRS